MTKYLFALLFCMIMPGSAWALEAGPPFTPEKALLMLREGNTRFVEGKRTYPRQDHRRIKEIAGKEQSPYATIVSCSDARVPPEHIFDAGFGDLFVIRVTGNICETYQAGTIEFLSTHNRTPLIVVMGHTKCGAVTTTALEPELASNLGGVASKIKVAADRVHAKKPGLAGQKLVEACTIENIWVTIEDLLRECPILKEKARKGEVKIIGALYDMDTGKVSFLGSHPEDKKQSPGN
jgi:carbonic anhydrase